MKTNDVSDLKKIGKVNKDIEQQFYDEELIQFEDDFQKDERKHIDEESYYQLANLVKYNETKFQKWYEFVKNVQLQKMSTYIQGSFDIIGLKETQIIQLTQKQRTLDKQISNQLGQSTKIKSNYQVGMEQNKFDVEEKFQVKIRQEKLLEELLNKIQESYNSLEAIGVSFSSCEELGKLSEEQITLIPELVEIFQILNYILFDQTIWDWNRFQKQAFQTKIETDRTFFMKWQELARDNPDESTFMLVAQNVGKDIFADFINQIKVQKQTQQQPSGKFQFQFSLSRINFEVISFTKLSMIKDLIDNKTLLDSNSYQQNKFQIQKIFKWGQQVNNKQFLQIQIISGNQINLQKERVEAELTTINKNLKELKKVEKNGANKKLCSEWSTIEKIDNIILQNSNTMRVQLDKLKEKIKKSQTFILNQVKEASNQIQTLESSIKIKEEFGVKS